MDTIENYMASIEMPLPPQMHIGPIKSGLKEMRDEVKRIYFAAGGEDVWQ